MRRLHIPVIIGLIVWLAACSTPSEDTARLEVPTATEALTRLETLSTLTPAPTFTPILVNTVPPWRTQTPVPTATPLASLTPLPTINTTLVPFGIKVEKQKDGTTLVTDYDNKFKFTAPVGWTLASSVNKDPASILTELGKDFPRITKTTPFINMLAPKITRIVGIDTSSAYANPDYPLVLRVALFTDPGKALLQLDLAISNVRDGLQNENFTVTKTTSKTYANGIKAGVVDATTQFFYRRESDRERILVEVHYRVVVFQAGGKLIMVSTAAPKQFIEAATSAVDKVVASLTFMK